MELIKITNTNIELIDDVMEMIADEWGDTFSSSKSEKALKFKNSISKGEKYHQAYILKLKNDNIGSFLILEHELKDSDLSPWLACVVVNKKYRGQGYGGILLDYIKDVIEKNFSTIYLKPK